MATLSTLKQALKPKVPNLAPQQPLSEAEYSAGFEILVNGSDEYRDFIAPQLTQVLSPLFNSRNQISVLEIGPGPATVLRYLPAHMRRKISRYAAYEPNNSYATALEEHLSPAQRSGGVDGKESPFPYLVTGYPKIHRRPFPVPATISIASNDNNDNITATPTPDQVDKFDVVLFCHSMYGMKGTHEHIWQHALNLLALESRRDGLVLVFHRADGSESHTLGRGALLPRHTASFPSGAVRVADPTDARLDAFCAFVAGFAVLDESTRKEWRAVCRALGSCRGGDGDLVFSAPGIMLAFGFEAARRGTMELLERTGVPPTGLGAVVVKNRAARMYRPAAVVRPASVQEVQSWVQWALSLGIGLTVIGGGHSGHCLWPHVVAVSMDRFREVCIVPAEGESWDVLVVVGGGCTTRDVVERVTDAGLVVPLGSRPSVGAGLWLQGGIGHLARRYGLACDAIVGAVVVTVDSGHVVYVGEVPSQHRPPDATRAKEDTNMLWALRGGGTNFGIVISVVFKPYAPAPTHYMVRHWIAPLSDMDSHEAQQRTIANFDVVAQKLPRAWSADAFLFWDANKLHLGVTMYGLCYKDGNEGAFEESDRQYAAEFTNLLGTQARSKKVDALGLFEADMYMSEMHGGHGGGKTTSFKRCVFLTSIGQVDIAKQLIAAMETRPSPLCYLHLLHGGGAVRDTPPRATAFGCRKWDYACVVTGVWLRDQDGTQIAQAAMDWVYSVVTALLPSIFEPAEGRGVYGADLGPDPRDAALARKAFGTHLPRLARLKRLLDPCNVLAYTCPLPRTPPAPKLILLVTGEIGAGKDSCAARWHNVFRDNSFTVYGPISISIRTKRQYANATGADLDRLLVDRAYKEQHRPALTAFFQNQVQRQPELPGQYFSSIVECAAASDVPDRVDVLLITGMRDEAPVARFSHLVPNSRLLEIRVTASREAREHRAIHVHVPDNSADGTNTDTDAKPNHRPTLVFDNSTHGYDAVMAFAEHHLLPLLHPDFEKLANMIRTVPNFPRLNINFRHVLNIAQQPGGISLCTSLLRSHFSGTWSDVDRIVCCEAGGFMFASALAMQVDIPLALIRKGPDKLPRPRIFLPMQAPSHISLGADTSSARATVLEMECGLVARGNRVVVVDDVLATGRTLCAVLRLLVGLPGGFAVEDISVLVVAEFPGHRGREFLRRSGFGGVGVQSLLVFDGA
ncbi:phosphoribosyl transferase domain protein [Podospora appendiculata]|uniref:Phosphoribosyl transferase domain protein n=1 Tax=Podospora appendiculata TaxID=314037 RepID=A0AAE0XLM7_9PEZI|nr:phosphoribosyl transferase domain protein [Podospora appendiculata]